MSASTTDFITTTDGVNIFYKDWGSGQPIVFSHGWPLTADDWDAQMTFFLRHGYRVIAHDRRGHGRSDLPSTGNDMDHWVADLASRRLRCSVRAARSATQWSMSLPVLGWSDRPWPRRSWAITR